MVSIREWYDLFSLAQGDAFQRCHALLMACVHVDRELQKRYAGASFMARVHAAHEDDGDGIDVHELRAAWSLRNLVTHEASVASNRRIGEVFVPLARAHLSLTGRLTPPVEQRLYALAEEVVSLGSDEEDFEVPLPDAPEILSDVSGEDSALGDIGWGVSLVLASALVDMHVLARGAYDDDFDDTLKLKAKVAYALDAWLDRQFDDDLSEAIHVRNMYAHESDLPAIATTAGVTALLALAEDLAEQTAELSAEAERIVDDEGDTEDDGGDGETDEPDDRPDRAEPSHVPKPQESVRRPWPPPGVEQTLAAPAAPARPHDGRSLWDGTVAYAQVWFVVAGAIAAIGFLAYAWTELGVEYERMYQGVLNGYVPGGRCRPSTPCQWNDIDFAHVPAFIPMFVYLVMLIVFLIVVIIWLVCGVLGCLVVATVVAGCAGFMTRLLSDGGRRTAPASIVVAGALFGGGYLGWRSFTAAPWFELDTKDVSSIESTTRPQQTVPMPHVQVPEQKAPPLHIDKACPQRAPYRITFGPIRRRVVEATTCQPGDVCGYLLFSTAYPCTDGGDVAGVRFRDRLTNAGCPGGQLVVFDDMNCTRAIGVVFSTRQEKERCIQLLHGNVPVMAKGYSVMRDMGGICD